MALEQFNNNNTQKISVIYEDDKGEPKSSVNAINKLISIDKVQLIIGAMPSSNTLSIAPIAEKNKVVLISPTSTASSVSNAGDYIFRVCVSDKLEGKSMADYLMKNYPLKKIGILYINNDYGVGLADDFSNEISKQGSRIIEKIGYQEGSSDFRSIISRFQKSKIEILYIIAYKEQNFFFSQCEQLNFKTLFAGTTMIEDPELIQTVNDFANGIIYTYRSYDPLKQDSITQNFVTAYKRKYNSIPDFYAASNYDAAKVAFYCIKNTKYVGSEIKDFLYKIRDFQGVTGRITFDKNGDVLQSFSIKKISNGKFIYVK